MTLRSRTRFARCGAALVLMVMCALVSAVGATQATSDSTPAKKPAASKTTHKKPVSSSAKPLNHPSSAHSATTSKTRAAAGKNSRKKTVRVRGQQKIDSDRAEQIQEALIREHYLTGEPTGSWNTASEDAMRRYQADHGWQTKEVPDSRALIRLGLGPSNDHLLNPESAMTTGPAISRAAPPTSAAHSDPVSHGPEPASSQSGSSESRSSGTMTPALPGDPPPAASSDHNACGPQ